MTLTIILTCVLFSMFFSGMEVAIYSLQRARILHLAEQGVRGAQILLRFHSQPQRLSSMVLVGNTLTNGIATILFIDRVYSFWGFGLATLALIIFSLFLWFYADLVPKAVFRHFPHRLAVRLAPLLLFSHIILWPLIKGFEGITRTIILILGGRVPSETIHVTREEIKTMAGLSGEQRNMVSSILDSRNAKARDVMTPRSEVVVVRQNSSMEERQRLAESLNFSRLPIETNTKQWEGIWSLYDDLFHSSVEHREVPRFHEDASLDTILKNLRKKRSQIGFVKDQHGNDIGLVSIEDVLRRYLGKVDL